MNNSLPEIRPELIPHLVCDPCSDAIAFYEKAFGAKETFRLPAEDGKRIMHAEMKIGDASIYLVDDFPEYCDGKSQSPKTLGGSSVTIHRQVPDCDAAMAQAESAGATVRMPATDMFWGDRYGCVVDPFGHTWSFATPQRTVSREELEEAVKSMEKA